MTVASLDTIYQNIASERGWQKYRLLFQLQDIFIGLMEFDPANGEVLPTTVDDVLQRMGQDYDGKEVWWNDRLQHIVDFAVPAVRHILESLRSRNIREYRIVRPERVRETDGTCIRWLSKQPGHTIRQKINSRQRMMGVFHDTSIDTTENRLFKAFLERLHTLLVAKEACCKTLGIATPPETTRFIGTVHRWLRGEEAARIRPWNHLPPNNTLLGHKHYRTMWKAWIALQSLNEQNQRDCEHLDIIKIETLLWLVAVRLNRSDSVRFLQSSLSIDYKELSIGNGIIRIPDGLVYNGTWRTLKWYSCPIISHLADKACRIDSMDRLYSTANDTVSRIQDHFFSTLDFSSKEMQTQQGQEGARVKVAALDLCSVLPAYTSEWENGRRTAGRFSQKLLYQASDEYEYSCRHAKFIDGERTTYSIHSILNGGKKDALEKPSLDFCRTIKDQLRCETCIYIVHDDIDDFSYAVSTFKRNMENTFVQAKILPRSIAAIFSRLKKIQDWYLSFSRDDHKTKQILVVDRRDDRNLVIELDVEVDRKGLTERNPDTGGLVFRRLAVKSEKPEAKEEPIEPHPLNGILTDNDASLLAGQFSVGKVGDVYHFENPLACNQNEDLLDSDKYTIFLSEVDDVSAGGLEYHHLQGKTPDIPLWSIRLPRLAMRDSSGKEFILVEPDKVFVQPTGKPEKIPVAKEFELGTKKNFYEFPLIQGEEEKQAEHYAYIENAALPLKAKTNCKLHLTYTYGNPMPYELEFRPKDQSASFRILKVEWESSSHEDGVHNMPYPDFVREYTWKDVESVPNKKAPDEPPRDITGQWLPGQYEYLRKYDSKKYKTTSQQNYSLNKLRSSLRFPALTAWNNGRSIFDADCPSEFKERTLEILDFIRGNKIYDIDSTVYLPKNYAREWCFFLACMHKDTPKEFSDLLCGTYFDHLGDESYEDTKEEYFHIPKWIAYALGDCSQPWQEALFKRTIDLLDGKKLDGKKSEYGVKILAIALWRVRDFVGKFDLEKTKKLLEACLAGVQQDESLWLSASLECILALCRLRDPDRNPSSQILEALSSDKNPVVKNLLSALEGVKRKGVKELKTFLKFESDGHQEGETDKGQFLLDATSGYLSGSINNDSIRVIEADFLPD